LSKALINSLSTHDINRNNLNPDPVHYAISAVNKFNE